MSHYHILTKSCYGSSLCKSFYCYLPPWEHVYLASLESKFCSLIDRALLKVSTTFPRSNTAAAPIPEPAKFNPIRPRSIRYKAHLEFHVISSRSPINSSLTSFSCKKLHICRKGQSRRVGRSLKGLYISSRFYNPSGKFMYLSWKFFSELNSIRNMTEIYYRKYIVHGGPGRKTLMH